MNKQAIWIGSPKNDGSRVYSFKKSFSTKKAVKKATLTASSIGVYMAEINGIRVGNEILAPGWTCYKTRVQYQSYDVTSLIKDSNEVTINVGNGWAVGDLGYSNERGYYAKAVSAIAAVELLYTDGTKECIATDESWTVYTNEVTYSELYHGETVDKCAKIECLGGAVRASVKTKLIPRVGERITEQERIFPIKLIKTPKGERVIDFGQNLAGLIELKIKAPRGSRIVLHHAEVLDKEGNFYNENYRRARSEYVFITDGDDNIFKPTYTFQGFRYIRLTEYPFDEVDLSSFCAIAVNSEIKRTGSYRCGNEKINQLYHNIIWGQKSNYIDIPTDCPQRDERLGWTGDAQVFCRTAAINFDVEKFFKKWLADMAIEQKRFGGAVMGVIPIAQNRPTCISAAWGDAACIIPWEMYLAYGDKKALKECFPMMKSWVDFLRTQGPEEYLWLGGNHYGDWLAMDAGGDSYSGATSTDLIGSAFYAYSTGLVIKAGEVLGENVSKYRELYASIVKAFRDYFMDSGMPKATLPPPINTDKTYAEHTRRCLTQTGITLLLHFGLATEEERPALARELVRLVEENGGLMTTGFVGTPYILHALSDNGYTDVAYSLLFREKNPSWLYSVTHGATTMWEHWNGIKEDGSFWMCDMNSFNHYAYGAVYDWIFGVSSGIKAVDGAPAYKEVNIAPHPDKRLGFADASIDSRNGKVRSYWYYKGDTVYYEFEIPDGVTAHITLPSGRKEDLGGGQYFFAE